MRLHHRNDKKEPVVLSAVYFYTVHISLIQCYHESTFVDLSRTVSSMLDQIRSDMHK
jgi:hypothetical protein